MVESAIPDPIPSHTHLYPKINVKQKTHLTLKQRLIVESDHFQARVPIKVTCHGQVVAVGRVGAPCFYCQPQE